MHHFSRNLQLDASSVLSRSTEYSSLNSLVAGLTSGISTLKIWSTKSAEKRHLCASISAHSLYCFEYFICCGIFDVFQLELRSQKQQASSIVFENAFKLLLGNRSFKILITKQLGVRILRHERERLFTKPFKSFADFLFKK